MVRQKETFPLESKGGEGKWSKESMEYMLWFTQNTVTAKFSFTSLPKLAKLKLVIDMCNHNMALMQSSAMDPSIFVLCPTVA